MEEGVLAERGDVFGAEAGAPGLRAGDLPRAARRAVVDPQVACTQSPGIGREQQATAPRREVATGQAESGEALDELFGAGFRTVGVPDAAVAAYEGCLVTECDDVFDRSGEEEIIALVNDLGQRGAIVVKMSVRSPPRYSLLASVR